MAPVFFGAAIEVMQECLTSARGGDFFDFLFNSLGVLFAALFSFILTMPIMKKYGLWNRRGRGKWN